MCQHIIGAQYMFLYSGIKASLPDRPLGPCSLEGMKQPRISVGWKPQGPSLQPLLLPQDGGGSAVCRLSKLRACCWGLWGSQSPVSASSAFPRVTPGRPGASREVPATPSLFWKETCPAHRADYKSQVLRDLHPHPCLHFGHPPPPSLPIVQRRTPRPPAGWEGYLCVRQAGRYQQPRFITRVLTPSSRQPCRGLRETKAGLHGHPTLTALKQTRFRSRA